MNLGRHDVADLIEKTTELLAQRLAEHDVRVVREFETGLPAVRGDAEQLRQVFINLMNNSSEAMVHGGEIRIEARRADDMVVVRIQDSGHGMGPDVTSRIFEPFFSTKEQGTGLGLCIAGRVMERHGGRLVLESTTPRGTTFAVWIPQEAGRRESRV